MSVDDTEDRARLLAVIEGVYEDAAQAKLSHVHEPRPTLGDIADALLAAGFGCVSEAKAERDTALAVIERAKAVDNYDISLRYWEMLAILAKATS